MTDFLNAYDVQPDELTISEVAKILRCSRQMVLKICHKYMCRKSWEVTLVGLPEASIILYRAQNSDR